MYKMQPRQCSVSCEIFFSNCLGEVF